MATLPELTRLFAQLAANLRRSDDSSITSIAAGDLSEETSNAISSLTASLNSPSPGSRVLDAALSLMCFSSHQMFEARIECLVSTIVSVLSSMASCSVCRLGEGDQEFIRVGSSISFRDCEELIWIGANVLENLQRQNGAFTKMLDVSQTLLHTILKAAVSSSDPKMFLSPTSVCSEEKERITAGRRTAITKLVCFLPDEASFRINEIPLRLFLWHLDPLILKHDISEILRETIERPFLYLKEELRARMSWHSVIICFVTSPTMFQQARTLIHSWLLLTGLASVLNLQIALISSVLDVLSRPLSWGVSMEMGMKFLFPHAYFPKKHRKLLTILTGPISCESFLDLVHHIGTGATPVLKNASQHSFHASGGIFGHEAMENAKDNYSTWSVLMGFPAWFYFATILIFHKKDSQNSSLSKAIFGGTEADKGNFQDLQKAAVFFLSWVLNPLDKASFDLLADRLQETSRSWNAANGVNFMKGQFPFYDTLEKKTHTRSRRLRISKANASENLQLAAEDDKAWAVGKWLKEFDSSCVQTCKRAVISQMISTKAKEKHSANLQPNLVHLKIPLGILITSSYLDEKGCELLLHYANTGEILQLIETPKNILGCFGNDLPSQFEGSRRSWPIDGACLVFNFFDILQDLSVGLYVSEDSHADFICQMKDNVSGYLLRCVKAILELSAECFQVNEARESVLVDLYRRLTRWKQTGRDIFEGYSTFDGVLDDFARRFKIAEENLNC